MGKASGRYGFYGVARGRNVGVFSSWEACRKSVERFSAPLFRGFHTHQEAFNFVARNTLLELESSSQQSSNWTVADNDNTTTSRNRNIVNNEQAPSGRPITEIALDFPNATTTLASGEGATDARVPLNTMNSPYVTPPVSPPRLKRSPTKSTDPFHGCSAEQTELLSSISGSRNIFFTGSAGTGKTFVIQRIRELLKNQGYEEYSDFFITASTGAASYHIGGTTLHHFLGCGLAEDGVLELTLNISPRARKQLEGCKILIIDEVSMISAEFFDKLDYIARCVRGRAQEPFGGIRLILSGDFFQLAPVNSSRKPRRCPRCGGYDLQLVQLVDKQYYKCLSPVLSIQGDQELCHYIFPVQPGYLFESSAWRTLELYPIELTTIYRQDSLAFITALNLARMGILNPSSLEVFRRCCRPLSDDGDVKATHLYATRYQADEENRREFDRLETPVYSYSAMDSREEDALNDLHAAKTIFLRVGAQVMLLANLNVQEGLVNGTRGIVTGFATEEEIGKYIQQHADECELQNWNSPFPKVLFELKDTTREILVTPHAWTIQLSQGNTVSRRQIPLMLSWALTFHKCQGMTLRRYIVHLAQCFGFGMAYVALSRCKSLEGLQICGWREGTELKADPRVQDFYHRLRLTMMNS